MSILSTSSKLIKVGQDYIAGSGISIDDYVISVTGEFGKTYSAGQNVDIYEQDEQLYISSKDWTNDIAEASANAYNEAVSQIPDPFDPSYLSAQIDNKLNSSDFTTWQNGQYSTDLQTIEGQINNKLDTSSFSDVSGSFLTAHQSLDGYATEDWVTAQGYITGVDLSNYYTKDETSGKEELAQAFADIPVGDPEVNAYVTDNSASLNGTTDLVQNSSGLWNDVAVYQSNSANYLTAHQDISYKLDESAFADVSGTFLTAHQDLSNYYTTAEADSLSSMFSGAIDYVSANAGDPNALTGYQGPDVVISATSSLFDVSSNYFNLHVGEGGHFSAYNSCSAIFNNGSKFINTNNGFISADGSYGFYTSGNTNTPAVLSVDSSKGFYTSANGGDLFVRNGGHLSANNAASAVFTNVSLVSADGINGILISGRDYKISSNYAGFKVSSTNYGQIFSMNDGVLTYSADNNVSSVLNLNGLQISGRFGTSAGIGNFNGTTLYANIGPMKFNVTTTGIGWSNSQMNSTAGIGNWQGNGIGYSGMGSKFEVCNGSTASLSNGGTLEVHQGAVISADMGGHLKAVNGASAILDGGKTTYIFGANNLTASGSQFVSADGEGVSAWKQAPMVALGQANQTSSNAAFVIGNGVNNTARSDLFVIDYSGNAQTNDFIAGNGNKLSDSIQTSELEFDSNAAITAIAGSAIGGGGVTGEFVPQSAFDELKQSYDALSSLFATYSGQWLLPNEGEE